MKTSKFLNASYSPEDNSEFEIDIRRALHHILQGNFLTAIKNLNDQSSVNMELRNFARILEGFAYYSDNKLYQAASHMNAYVETLLPEDSTIFRILRDFYLMRADKNVKDINDEWATYCFARYEYIYDDDDCYTTEVKDPSVKEPDWGVKE